VPLAAQLRHAHPGVILLGSNGWNDPAQLGTAASDLDGAVFVDGFFPSSQRRGTQEFVAAYRAAFGGTPEILEAQAYDAGKLVAAVVQSGARSRAQINSALQSPRTIDGATGPLVIGPGGIQRQLYLLRISTGTISEITAGHAPLEAAPPPVPVARPADMQPAD
jgi:ABC-type branched-subunit amino acid transport system substrate-binding protein